MKNPISHLEDLAEELVVYRLIMASFLGDDSTVGRLASERLIRLAYIANPELTRQTLAERKCFQDSFSQILEAANG